MTDTFTYTILTDEDKQNIVLAEIANLEQQHFALTVGLATPAEGGVEDALAATEKAIKDRVALLAPAVECPQCGAAVPDPGPQGYAYCPDCGGPVHKAWPIEQTEQADNE